MVPGGAIVGESAEGEFLPREPRVPTTRPCKGTRENLRAWPEIVRTPTQVAGIWVFRTDSLSERRLLKAPG